MGSFWQFKLHQGNWNKIISDRLDSVWAAGDARTDIREMGYCYNDFKRYLTQPRMILPHLFRLISSDTTIPSLPISLWNKIFILLQFFQSIYEEERECEEKKERNNMEIYFL